MIKIPLYTNKKLLMAFEYGLIFGEVARERGFELNSESVKKMEKIITNEFKKRSYKKVTLEMIPNILAAFEIK